MADRRKWEVRVERAAWDAEQSCVTFIADAGPFCVYARTKLVAQRVALSLMKQGRIFSVDVNEVKP